MLNNIQQKILSDDSIFIKSFEDLTRDFLQFYNNKNIQISSFEELKDYFLENNIFNYDDYFRAKSIGKSLRQRKNNLKDESQDYQDYELSNGENYTDKQYYQAFCEYVLNIYQEPKAIFLENYQQIVNDLETIKSNLCYLNIKKIEIENKKEKSEENEYRKLLVSHYINRNQLAKEEIINLLSQPELLRSKILIIITSPKYLFDSKFFYPYRIYSKGYDINNYSELLNKFPDITLEQIKQMEVDRENNPLKFIQKIKSYIKDKTRKLSHNNTYFFTLSILFRQKIFWLFSIICSFLGNYGFNLEVNITQIIEKMVNNNHALFKRRAVIKHALCLYNQNNYLIFINLVTIQIEGIFYDYCKEIGIDENRIEKSFPKKMKQIEEKDKYFWEYEYFSFSFPLIRNEVAHGLFMKRDKNEMEIIAHLLLLDLYNICEKITSSELPIIEMRKIIESLKNDDGKKEILFNSTSNDDSSIKKNLDKVKELLQMKLMIIEGYKIPDFYQDLKYFEDIINKSISNNDDFWDVLFTIAQLDFPLIEDNQELKTIQRRINTEIHKILGKLKSENIRYDNCTKIFTKLQKTKKLWELNENQKSGIDYQQFLIDIDDFLVFINDEDWKTIA